MPIPPGDIDATMKYLRRGARLNSFASLLAAVEAGMLIGWWTSPAPGYLPGALILLLFLTMVYAGWQGRRDRAEFEEAIRQARGNQEC